MNTEAMNKDVKSNASSRAYTRKKYQKKSREEINEEKRVLNLLRQQDPEGLRIVMDKYHDRLFSVANRICHNQEDSEEVLQDVYMTALNKIDRFEERSTLSTWLYRITVNASLMKLRSHRSRKDTVPMDNVVPFVSDTEDFFGFKGQARSPDDRLMDKELLKHINDTVENLPEIYQGVFMLRDVEGFSIKETSKKLHSSNAAIKSRLHRCRYFLRESLDQYLCEN